MNLSSIFARPIALLGLVVLPSVACGSSDEGQNPDPGPPPEIEPATTFDAYMLGTYDEARDRFRASGQILSKRHARVELDVIDVPSATDTDLTIDTIFIPAQKSTEKLLIMSTGVHGVEGFVGSAVQQMFMAEILPSVNLDELSILFIHALNPWGYRHLRRVTENNVDLNRNFDVTSDLFATENAPYADIDYFLNPTEPVTQQMVDNGLSEVLGFAVTYPREELQQAILGGQYEFPKGLYFGGTGFEPQKAAIETMIAEKIADHDAVFLMDFHTGYGERAKLHLFGAPNVGDPEAMNVVFEGYEIDTGADNPDFYETTGDFTVYLGQLAGAKPYVGMTMEYGTMDSQTDLGAAKSLVNMRLENQGFHHGYAEESARAAVENQFLDMYNPPEAEWRTAIMTATKDMLPVFIERFSNLP